jgi:hypothetical protein
VARRIYHPESDNHAWKTLEKAARTSAYLSKEGGTPMSVVEHSHPWYRSGGSGNVEVRAAGRFSANEVREILTRTETRDLRELGCPEWLFVRALDRAAKKINFRSTPTLQPAPAPSTDLSERLQSISLF